MVDGDPKLPQELPVSVALDRVSVELARPDSVADCVSV
jgi:hypothetical protein